MALKALRRDLTPGTVTSVTGTAPITSSGGATPDIAINPLFTLPRAAAAGTVDAITADFTPDITLADGVIVAVVSSGANTSATPSFTPDGLTTRTITTRGGGALVAGDIGAAGFVMLLEYNLANTRWELLNPVANANLTGPITSVGNATTILSLATATKFGNLTRVMNTASGDVAYTGVGFLPSKVLFFAVFGAAGWNAQSYGMDNITVTQCVRVYNGGVASSTDPLLNASISLVDLTGTTAQGAKIKTLDADGFTLTWTLSGAGNAGTATILYMAFK